MKTFSRMMLLTLATFALAHGAQAKPVSFLLYYPGGQGSQEQAQSLLDDFSEALKRVSDGKFEAEMTYIPEAKEGSDFIQTKKPGVGILSLDVFLSKGKTWNAQAIAQSLQLPSGDGKDQYFLLGKSAQIPGEKIKILTSRALEPSFIKTLFPNLKSEFEVETTPNVVSKLRSFDSAPANEFVVLDQFEYGNVSKLKTPWAQNLKVAAQSEKVQSSPVVVFKNQFPQEDVAALQEALVKLGQDSEAKETLKMLRLKGFKKS